MSVIAVGGVKHAPGATTLAVALAALATRRHPLLIEMDAQGGDIAARAGRPLDPGLLSLAASARRGLTPQLLVAHTQQLANGSYALLAPSSPIHARAALSSLQAQIAALAAQRPGLTLVDVGRWEPQSGAIEMALGADVALLVFRPTIEGVEHARTRLDLVPRRQAVLVAIGEHPYRAAEVTAALGGTPIHVVADDRRGAELAGAGAPMDRWSRRTAYTRSVAALLEAIMPADAAEAS